MKNLLAFVLLTCCFVGSLKSQQTLTQINGWNAYVHLPANYSSTTKTYPTIVFFPGIGEVGTNPAAVIVNGPGAYIKAGWNGNVVVDGNTVEFIVISLQTPTTYPSESVMNTRIQTIKSLYRVDPKRLYFTGLSHGGWCTTTFVTGDAVGGPYTYASQVAAVVEVEGMKPGDNAPYPNRFDNFSLSGGKLLGFEQKMDNRDVPTRINRMNATVPGSGIYVQTNFGGGGHCCWNQFYGGGGVQPGIFSLGGINQNMYQWMARQSLGAAPAPPAAPPANLVPTVNAGADVTITLPTSTASLTGSGSDADGSISTYSWTKISGGAATITNPAAASTTVTGLVTGSYQFQLRVTDNNGATATDTKNVTVNTVTNTPPVVSAGSSQTITLPASSVTVSGTASDPNGSIASTVWSKLSGPSGGTIASPNALTTTISGLVQGAYSFQLRATDNQGAISNSTVTITVNATGTAKSVKVNLFAGVNACSISEWNNWNVASSLNSAAFKFSDGTTSTVNAKLNYSQGVADNGAGYPGVMAPSEVLRYTSYSTSTRTLTISGLSTGKQYSLELFASRGSNSGNSSVFEINQQSVTINSYNNASTKASFSAVTPNAQGQIIVTIQRLLSDGFNYLNGFTITETGSSTATARLLTTTALTADTTAAASKLSATTTGNSFQIYPNPVKDRFMLEVANSHVGTMSVQIINLLGAVEKTMNFRKDQNLTQVNIPVDGFQSGVHFVKVQIGSWTETKRMIKM